MTTRTEPTIAIQGNSTTFNPVGLTKGWFGKAEVSHTELLDDALAGFTAAQTKLDAAIATITRSIADDEAEAAAIAQRRIEKTSSLSRLDRVKQRLENLLS